MKNPHVSRASERIVETTVALASVGPHPGVAKAREAAMKLRGKTKRYAPKPK